jgi:hypothetical protein
VKSEQRKPLAVGDMVHGFCQGFFGRDHYDCMQIIETGPDWVLLQSAGVEDSVHSMRLDGFQRLIDLMDLRDMQAEKGCEYDANLDNWGDGEGCHFKDAVKLTENGPYVRPTTKPRR